jgi:hypothetical protein
MGRALWISSLFVGGGVIVFLVMQFPAEQRMTAIAVGFFTLVLLAVLHEECKRHGYSCARDAQKAQASRAQATARPVKARSEQWRSQRNAQAQKPATKTVRTIG